MTDRLSQDREKIVRVLEGIPTAEKGPRPLVDICRQAGMNKEDAESISRAMVALLAPFRVLETVDDNGSIVVKACADSAALFLRSFAAFLREDREILANWKRPGNSDGPYTASEVLSGPQFLYLIEQARTIRRHNAMSLRDAKVAQVIIKAKLQGETKPVYLVQFDSMARQFQFIGGHQRPNDDEDIETTAIRELNEELHANAFNFPTPDRIVPLGKVEFTALSRTYGVSTAYEIDYFQLIANKAQLRLSPNDRWVTRDELLKEQTKGGVPINTSALHSLDESLPSGLDGLPLSIQEVQRRSIRQIAKEHPYEVAGLVLGVIGIILSIAFFIWS